MAKQVIIDNDFVKVEIPRKGGKSDTRVLAWGDTIEVVSQSGDGAKVRIDSDGKMVDGVVKKKIKERKKGVFQLSFPDVGQGDAMVLKTPAGKLMLIDGGHNVQFARYLATCFPGATKASPLEVEAVLVTHGDGDHFAGLNEIGNPKSKKPMYILPKRIFHNGLVKGSGKDAKTAFGPTVWTGDKRVVVDLARDIRNVAETRMNKTFKTWAATVKRWDGQGTTVMERLAFGDEAMLDFLDKEGIGVKVLGPVAIDVTHAGTAIRALPLLHASSRKPGDSSDGGYDAGRTINGHSVVLHLTYGNVRFLLGGDLNNEGMQILRGKVRSGGLEAEVLKVPHHGSEDFDLDTLRAVSPVVSIVSSGDKTMTGGDHIHPRANLMGALGRVARGDENLVFCTETSAFYEYVGPSTCKKPKKSFLGFNCRSYGIVHVRTDGKRVLVFTHSGKAGAKEAYRFDVDANHAVTFNKAEKP